MYDIAIVGAGPAGATLARLIGDHCKVLLIDRRRLGADAPPGRGKCCGGLLAPDAQKMLGQLGLGLPRRVLVEPQLFCVRAVDAPAGPARFYQRHYVNIDREKFDRWLVSMIPGGVSTRFGCRFEGLGRAGRAFSIGLRMGRARFVERARALVGADGAASIVRKYRTRRRVRSYIAVQDWYETPAAPPYFSAIFDPQVTDFYAWTIPKEGVLIVGAALAPGKDAPAKFELLARRLRAQGLKLGRRIRRQAAPLLRPATTAQLFPGRDGVALIGEAAGFVSPSSAEGISYALASAAMLAAALAPGPAGAMKRYRRAAGRLKRNIAAKLLKSRLIYTPAVRRALMASGLHALPVRRDQKLPLATRLVALEPGDIL